jgi:hypothetical protein
MKLFHVKCLLLSAKFAYRLADNRSYHELPEFVLPLINPKYCTCAEKVAPQEKLKIDPLLYRLGSKGKRQTQGFAEYMRIIQRF